MTDTLEILEKVNSFYASSFSSLMNLVICVLGIIGVLLPVLITIFQSKQIKIQKDDLISLIDTHMKNGIDTAKNELDVLYSKKIIELEEKFNKLLQNAKAEHDLKVRNVKNFSNGASCHIQGNLYLQQNFFLDAGLSFIGAAESYIAAMEELNLNRVLNLLIKNVIPFIGNQDDIAKISTKSNQFLTNIQKINASGRYSDIIEKYNEAISIKIKAFS